METGKDNKQEQLDWESRTLCGDESCIGVIGPDGRCNECGKDYGGEPPKKDPAAEAGEEIEDHVLETDLPDDADPDLASDIDWEGRTLCSDESCIGVIGPDGHCRECGKPLAGG